MKVEVKPARIRLNTDRARVATTAPTYILEQHARLVSDIKKRVTAFQTDVEAHQRRLDLVRRVIDIEGLCAIGDIVPRHFYLDEFGAVSLTRDLRPDALDIVYDRRVFAFMTSHWETGLTLEALLRKYPPTYPLLRNTGAPVVIPKNSVVLNYLISLFNALLAQSAWEARDLSIVEAYLSAFAEPAFINFSRLQHTAKDVPVYAGSWYMTKNFEPRVRVVNATVKPWGMMAKRIVSVISGLDMESDRFTANPQFLRRFLGSRAGNFKLSFDHSRFDLRHGGNRLRKVIQLLAERVAEIWKLDAKWLYELFSVETNLPAYYPSFGALYVTEPWSNLKSGDSKTSRLGSYMAWLEAFYIVRVALNWSVDDAINAYGKDWLLFTFGDDTLVTFADVRLRNTVAKQAAEIAERHLLISIDIEEPSGYIGKFLYDGDNNLYSNLKSYASKTLFPERKKSAVALPVALWTRYNDLSEGDRRTYVKLVALWLENYQMFASSRLLTERSNASGTWLDYLTQKGGGVDTLLRVGENMIRRPDDPQWVKYMTSEALTDILEILGRGLEHDVNVANLGPIAEYAQRKVFLTEEQLVSELAKKLGDKSQRSTFYSTIGYLVRKYGSSLLNASKARELAADLIRFRKNLGLIGPKLESAEKDWLFVPSGRRFQAIRM